jgi:hypothetical protein
MRIEAFPTRLVAVTDGVHRGEAHIVVFLEHAAMGEPRGFALDLADARALLAALTLLVPEVDDKQTPARDLN